MKYSLSMGSQICHPSSIGGSAPIQDQTRVFSLLGSLPAYLGRCHQSRPFGCNSSLFHILWLEDISSRCCRRGLYTFFDEIPWRSGCTVVQTIYLRIFQAFLVCFQWFKMVDISFRLISILYIKRWWGINYVILKNLMSYIQQWLGPQALEQTNQVRLKEIIKYNKFRVYWFLKDLWLKK